MSAPRWKCPECGSKNMQISLPAWHTETDEEADVMWWCPDCNATGHGEPIDRNDKEEA